MGANPIDMHKDSKNINLHNIHQYSNNDGCQKIVKKGKEKILVQYFLKPHFLRGKVEHLSKLLLYPPQQHIKKVLEIRQLTGSAYTIAKKSLPLFNCGAIFNEGKREVQNILEFTNLLSIDIDNVINTDEVKNLVSKLNYCLYAGDSVSGKGVFLLLKYADSNQHHGHFAKVLKDLKQLGFVLGKKEGGGGSLGYVDTSCSDQLRDRFISYDPKPFINPNAIILTETEQLYKPTPQRAQEPTSIGAGDHWVKRAVSYASKCGFSFTDGQKHNFLLRFATACNLLGVPIDECRQYVYLNYLPEEQIKSNVFTPYVSRANLHGKWKGGDQ